MEFAGFLFFIFSIVLLIWFGRRMDSIARDSKRSADALERMALQRGADKSTAVNPQGTIPASLYGRAK